MVDDWESYGTSRLAALNRRQRGRTFAMTNGKCFYCGGALLDRRHRQARDWLFLYPARSRMVQEHVTPRSRGGDDRPENYVPSCAWCNRLKGSFTLDEFRFISGLQRGDLSFTFPFEPLPVVLRDWLCCHSPSYERGLVLHNKRHALDGYELMARQKGGQLVREARVRPVPRDA